ncbi:hypothetical protein [Neptunitalea lumnitzerae]|uniref:hypothetical protein n=1 Tax=Neptunitalea lumnitzerae TaxID=2965509 RepID=UPI00248FB605|nr:hypothetical protein [Neptunitalea sp. Y10]
MHSLLIDNLGYFFMGINALVFSFFTKGKSSPTLYWFRWYAWSIVLVQIVTAYYSSHKMNNLFISHFYFNFQFITVSLMFKHLIHNKFLRKLNMYLVVLVPLFLVHQYVFNPEDFFNIYIGEVFLCSLPLVAYAVYYLYRSIELMNRKWIFFSSGLLLYLLSSSIVFSGYDILVRDHIETLKKFNFWILNNIIYLIYQIMVTIEWYENFRKNRNRRY